MDRRPLREMYMHISRRVALGIAGAATLLATAGTVAGVTGTASASPNLNGGRFSMTDTAVNVKTGKMIHLQRTVGTGNRWCYGQAQINAWSGGPWVNSYNGCPGPSNGDFTTIRLSPSTNLALEFTGGGAWAGRCVGDANNDPNDARTSLDSCGSNGVGEGWGVDFTFVGQGTCPSGQYYFRNAHWTGATSGYLGPDDHWVNGSHMYLNKQIALCFKYYPPA
jgi:hypothetical protein